MTPSGNAVSTSTPATGHRPPIDPIAAASASRARCLRRLEWFCWSIAILFAIAWALSLWFRFGFQTSASSMDIYDSQFRCGYDVRVNAAPQAAGVFAGRLDRAGDLPWVERLGLTLPRIDHDATPGRFDSLSVDLPMWLVVGFYAALAARFRRQRQHPDWQPRGTRLGAAAWTLATLGVAMLAFIAAVSELSTSGTAYYAAARRNRFAFVWSDYDAHKKHRIPEPYSPLTFVEHWAIEPPVFIAGTSWQNRPDLVACVPSWMVLLPCLYMTVRAWRRVKPIPPNLCKRCRYDLTGNTSGRCSECGRVIDWDIHGTRQ